MARNYHVEGWITYVEREIPYCVQRTMGRVVSHMRQYLTKDVDRIPVVLLERDDDKTERRYYRARVMVLDSNESDALEEFMEEMKEWVESDLVFTGDTAWDFYHRMKGTWK